jgi:uncharacterized protein (DUF111 family)
MTVGALIDGGADAGAVVLALEGLGTGAQFTTEKTRRCGITASKFRVIGGHATGHRHLKNILELIDASPLPASVKQAASSVFNRLGEAEAKVHGISIDKVHFHEVGAVDSICDIVGACAAFDLLDVDEIHCSPVNVGSGTVKTEHGVLPVPAPATAELLAGKPVYARGPSVALPPMQITATGYGAGDKDFQEHANVLRVLIGEASGAEEATTVAVLEANIDDSSPQVLGYAMEQLLEAGALDVTLESVLMKKNRQGTLLRVIAKPEDREALAQIVFAETSTLGLRIYSAERRVKARHTVEVETPHGKVRIKIAENGSYAPEYEDCRKLARETGVPLKQILADANLAYQKNIR